jgi:antitoxin component YwqK of YwqJK toxin-antitoxin module
MRKYVAVLVLAGLLTACSRSQESGYKNYEKWRHNDWSPRPLSGAPREVKETMYSELSDTSFQPPAAFSDFRIYRYDSSGNLIFLHSYLDSSYINEMHMTYEPEGVRRRLYAYDKVGGKPVDTNQESAKKIGVNKYSVTKERNSIVTANDRIETYFDDGAGMMIEFWQNGKPFGTVIYHYKNDRLVYTEKIRNKDTVKNIYYYSAKGFLDSITAVEKGVRRDVKVYVNNEQGDPVEIIEEEETMRFKYEYDSKGNWVKRLMYDPTPNSIFMPDSKFPNYLLTIREIKY